MNADHDNRAKTLKAAYQVCDLGPLEGDDQEKYYVDLSPVRDPSAIKVIKKQLDFSEPGQFRSILFTGHRGCGKTTELLRLTKQLEAEYRVISVRSDSVLDIKDIDYIDLYLVLIHEIMKEAAKLELNLDSNLIQRFQDWFKEITEETEKTVESYASLDTELGIETPFLIRLMAKLSAQIRGSHVQRQTFRTKLQKDIGSLQRNMNDLLDDAFEKLRAKHHQYSKGFLVIFDNLDRLSPELADRLYFDYATQLRDIACTLIYTVPISVVYSSKNINSIFGEPHIVGVANIYQKDESKIQYNAKALQCFSQLIEKRIDCNAVFTDPQLVMHLVKASGGHVRQLMHMIAKACLLTSEDKIDEKVIQSVIKQEQIAFDRVVPDEHYPLLIQVFQQKTVPQTEEGQRMLFNLSVLEYNGTQRWNYINPVILNSERFRKTKLASRLQ